MAGWLSYRWNAQPRNWLEIGLSEILNFRGALWGRIIGRQSG